MLNEHAAGRLQTHVYAFEVYSRKAKMLLALAAAQRAVKVGQVKCWLGRVGAGWAR